MYEIYMREESCLRKVISLEGDSNSHPKRHETVNIGAIPTSNLHYVGFTVTVLTFSNRAYNEYYA